MPSALIVESADRARRDDRGQRVVTQAVALRRLVIMRGWVSHAGRL